MWWGDHLLQWFSSVRNPLHLPQCEVKRRDCYQRGHTEWCTRDQRPRRIHYCLRQRSERDRITHCSSTRRVKILLWNKKPAVKARWFFVWSGGGGVENTKWKSRSLE